MSLGNHFHPTDEELLILLVRFLGGKYKGFMPQQNIYGEEDPWKIFTDDDHDSGKKVWYFFAPLQRKAKNGKRFSRKVGRNGTWHGEDSGQPIYEVRDDPDHHHQPPVLLGFKRRFLYKNGKELEQNGGWILQEFYLQEQVMTLLESKGNLLPERKDFVLCRLKRKKRQRKGNYHNRVACEEEFDIGNNNKGLQEESSSVIVGAEISDMDECDDATLISECFQGVEMERLEAPPLSWPTEVEINGTNEILMEEFFNGGVELLDFGSSANLHQPQQQQQPFSSSEHNVPTGLQSSDNFGVDICNGNFDFDNMDDQQWLEVLDFDFEPDQMTGTTSF